MVNPTADTRFHCRLPLCPAGDLASESRANWLCCVTVCIQARANIASLAMTNIGRLSTIYFEQQR